MSEAERLADAIDPFKRKSLDNLTCAAAAAELRYLQSKVWELRLSLDIAMNLLPPLRRKVVKKIIDDALIAARPGEKK